MATAFDTLKAAKQLRQSGFNEEQAEALSEVFQQIQESHLALLATKSDLSDTKNALITDLASLRNEFKTDLAGVRSELKNEMAEMKSDLTERVTKVEGRLSLVQWMLGFNLALTVAVLWLLIRSAGLA